MKKTLLTVLSVLMILCFSFGLTACGDSPVKFTINFVVDNEIVKTIDTAGNEIIFMPENPTKDGYTFEGWYWDNEIWQRPFTANSILNEPLSSDMSVYAKFNKNHNHAYTIQVATSEYLKSSATCTQKAVYYYSCSCGEKGTETFEYGNPLGHSFTNYISNNNATCTQDGTKTAKCDRCKATNTITDTNSKKGHSIENGVCKNCAEVLEYIEKVDDETYYVKLFNKTTSYNFTNKIETESGVYYAIYKTNNDGILSNQVLNNTVTNLSLGENTFYIGFTNGNTATVTVYRRHIYTVNFATNGGTSVNSQNIEEDRKATIPTNIMIKSGYTFDKWDFDFDSAEVLGEFAFSNCSSLTSVTIGDSVTSIGSFAFYDCYKLVEVINLSNNLNWLSNYKKFKAC